MTRTNCPCAMKHDNLARLGQYPTSPTRPLKDPCKSGFPLSFTPSIPQPPLMRENGEEESQPPQTAHYVYHLLWLTSQRNQHTGCFTLISTSDDTPPNFYAIYEGEATKYDMDYIKKYDEDLNIALIFMRRPLFVLSARHHAHRSARSLLVSVFVNDVRPVCSLKLGPDPNEQSAALLRAILTRGGAGRGLYQPATPNETPPLFHPSKRIPPARPSPSLGSCM